MASMGTCSLWTLHNAVFLICFQDHWWCVFRNSTITWRTNFLAQASQRLSFTCFFFCPHFWCFNSIASEYFQWIWPRMVTRLFSQMPRLTCLKDQWGLRWIDLGELKRVNLLVSRSKKATTCLWLNLIDMMRQYEPYVAKQMLFFNVDDTFGGQGLIFAVFMLTLNPIS